ncbi:MAG: hypothetical protein GF398_18215 [Chitinivibrionales bacterium]|nr:hypothetical protein [Chitinivibrionales bacterium]
MVTLKADRSRNILFAKFEGYIKDGEAEKAAQKLHVELQQLRPGFDIINDLTGYKFADVAAAQRLIGIMAHLKSRRVGRVVRVVNEDAVGVRQFKIAAERSNAYKAYYAKTVKDAEIMLGKADA